MSIAQLLRCLRHVLFKSAFTDPRDGKVYKTVKIGKQVWMAENLGYEEAGSAFYNNDAAYGEKYGRLYKWETAMKACPKGWHLPSNAEWDELYRFADGASSAEKLHRSKTVGKCLRAREGWSERSYWNDHGKAHMYSVRCIKD